MRAGPSGPRRSDWRDLPHPARLLPDHPHRAEVLARHARAVTAGLSTYIDPATGYTVFTAEYLADRGYCCSNDCRHCPWAGGEDDPEPTDSTDSEPTDSTDSEPTEPSVSEPPEPTDSEPPEPSV